MSIQRVNPGVPTGGQFAATVHAESVVTLDPEPSTRVRDALAQRADAERAADLTICRELAQVVRQRYPDAAFLQMDVSDQGSDAMYPVAILDSAGHQIDDEDNLLEGEAEQLCYELVDDGPWTSHRAYPLGPPARRTTGAPCLDLTSAASITDGQIAGQPEPEPEIEPASLLPDPDPVPEATPGWDVTTPQGLHAERTALAAARSAGDHDTADRIQMSRSARGLRRTYPDATHISVHDWQETTAVSAIRLGSSTSLDTQGVPVGQDDMPNPHSPLQQLAVLARHSDGPLLKLQKFDKPSGHTVIAIADLG